MTISQSKFETKMNISVEQYIHDSHSKLVSLIRELEKVLGKERADQIVSNWAEKESVNGVKEMVAAEPKRIAGFGDVKRLLRKWVDDIDGHNMEAVRITRETENESIAYVSACVLAKVLREMNAADIGHMLYCRHDFAGARAIDPRVGLRRKKTLMQGDECCDFEYYWDT